MELHKELRPTLDMNLKFEKCQVKGLVNVGSLVIAVQDTFKSMIKKVKVSPNRNYIRPSSKILGIAISTSPFVLIVESNIIDLPSPRDNYRQGLQCEA